MARAPAHRLLPHDTARHKQPHRAWRHPARRQPVRRAWSRRSRAAGVRIDRAALCGPHRPGRPGRGALGPLEPAAALRGVQWAEGSLGVVTVRGYALQTPRGSTPRHVPSLPEERGAGRGYLMPYIRETFARHSPREKARATFGRPCSSLPVLARRRPRVLARRRREYERDFRRGRYGDDFDPYAQRDVVAEARLRRLDDQVPQAPHELGGRGAGRRAYDLVDDLDPL
jgi:hypothetical protein